MEMKKKGLNKKFKMFMIAILLFFSFAYIAAISGYYESHVRRDTRLTADALAEFERDVAEGNPIDIRDYLEGNIHDFRNQYSRAGYNISRGINSVLTEGLGGAIDFFRMLFR